MPSESNTPIYQGQFGEFTITPTDRWGTIAYRAGLTLAALSFAIASSLILGQGATSQILNWVTFLYASFALGLGISLLTIHIYLRPLHQLLQLFWAIGVGTSLWIATHSSESLAVTIYEQPQFLLGVGFLFAALTGIYFKEAFCFNRLETKILTPLVPVLLLGHWMGIWPIQTEQFLLGIWSVLFLVFAGRKFAQPIPSDIGDKSVFEYLHQQSKSRKVRQDDAPQTNTND